MPDVSLEYQGMYNFFFVAVGICLKHTLEEIMLPQKS